jgi:hypothetical protein
LHVVIPDITQRDWAVNIRKYVARARHLDDLVALGSLPPSAAVFLDAAVRGGLNVLVAGPTQAGNATSCRYTLTLLEGGRSTPPPPMPSPLLGRWPIQSLGGHGDDAPRGGFGSVACVRA